MRRPAVLLLAFVFAATACDTGVSDAPPLTTLPPTTSVATEPATTDIEPPPVTESTEPTTTVAPTTTLNLDDEALAAMEQAYLDGYDAYHRAILDPSNEALRAELELYLDEFNLDGSIEFLDDMVRVGWAALPNRDGLAPRTEVIGAARFTNDQKTEGDLLVCSFNPEGFWEIGAAPDGSDALIRDDVFTVVTETEMRLVDGQWKSYAGDVLSNRLGELPCES